MIAPMSTLGLRPQVRIHCSTQFKVPYFKVILGYHFIFSKMTERPLFSFGVLADVQYGDKPDDLKNKRWFKLGR